MTSAPLDDGDMLVLKSEVAEGPQPKSKAAEPSQPMEAARFTWTIENFSRLNTKKHYSDSFVVGGYKWRVLIFPKGNNVEHLSMYLDVADSPSMPYGWTRYAQFSLAVVNQAHGKYTMRKDTQHQFNARESDWGFTSFMPLSEFYDPTRGYLVNDTCIIEAEVAVRKLVESKKETGFVGLKNQRAKLATQVEPASTTENQPTEEPPTSRFTWTIENFSRLNTKKHYSDTFVVGGYKWRVLIYPKGNNVEHLSMYLDVADSESLPYGWTRYTQFSLAVVNQAYGKYTMRKDTQHLFNARKSDWGFTSFMPLSELYDPTRGYLVNDTCIIEAEVAVRKVVDSKKETGFVGLKNQVATQVEPASTAENQPAEEPPTLRFTWTIENFSRLNTKKHYSDTFAVGAYKWRVLIYPKGNNVEHLSMYLDVADSQSLPYGWTRYAQFSLAVVNQAYGKYTMRKDTQHLFNARKSDWGFTSFMPLSELYDPTRGYLVNDTCIIEAEVAVRKVVDSKKETGFVGLKNQGATLATQVEPASTAENQPAEEPPTLRFTWTIENFSRLNTKKHYSDTFIFGGYKWRVLIYPKGNNVEHLSMYLDVADSQSLPYGWTRYAQFSLAVVNQAYGKYTMRKDTQHQFNAEESDWGFTSFMPLNEFYDPTKGYLVNDTCIFEAEVSV